MHELKDVILLVWGIERCGEKEGKQSYWYMLFRRRLVKDAVVCSGLEITFSLVLSDCQYNARFVLSSLNVDLPIPPVPIQKVYACLSSWSLKEEALTLLVPSTNAGW